MHLFCWFLQMIRNCWLRAINDGDQEKKQYVDLSFLFRSLSSIENDKYIGMTRWCTCQWKRIDDEGRITKETTGRRNAFVSDIFVVDFSLLIYEKICHWSKEWRIRVFLDDAWWSRFHSIGSSLFCLSRLKKKKKIVFLFVFLFSPKTIYLTWK